MSAIPGVNAVHAIITDECRTNRSDLGALGEAYQRVADEYLHLLEAWPRGRGVRFHLVLAVERPVSPAHPADGQEGEE